jgi:hypothetical protein
MAGDLPPDSALRKVLETALLKMASKMEEHYKERHPDEFLVAEAYGLFFIFWQHFDETLEYIIYKEAKLTRTHAAIIVSGLGFERKASIARSLLALNNDKHKQIIAIINRIINNAERNMLVHGVLKLEGNDARFIKRTTDNSIKMKAKHLDRIELMRKVVSIMNDIDMLHKTYGITPEHAKSWERTTDKLLSRFSTSPKPPSS